MPGHLTFLVLVLTVIFFTHDLLQNLLHCLTFWKLRGRCQMSTTTCGGVVRSPYAKRRAKGIFGLVKRQNADSLQQSALRNA